MIMNKIVYDLLLKLEQCDDRHNRCDYLIEHDEITYMLEYIEEKDKEIERLKNGYCELKVKCNNGECDCTNEEYNGMVESNMKLSLENDELRKNVFDNLQTIKEKDKEIERLEKQLNTIEKYIRTWKIEDINTKTMLILNDILLIKNGMEETVERLKGDK